MSEKDIKRIGFISTRIQGTDGVSLEISKWEAVLKRLDFECYFIAGESDRPGERTFLIDQARFDHPVVKEIDDEAFGREKRSPDLTAKVIDLAQTIRSQLRKAVKRFSLDMIIVENAFTIPMNIPLGMALLHFFQEKDICCIAHHHDFFWERERYLINCVDDYLLAAFPPQLVQIQHIVINSQAATEFSRRTGLSCRIIPNVMDFEAPPKPADDYAKSFRQEIGLSDNDLLILQPTRVVARKGIEHAIEIVRRLNNDAKLVITHTGDDEGTTYATYIRQFAELMNVELLFVENRIAYKRDVTTDGKKIFTIADAYSQADLVTYPSRYEGFGNAFLEAVYFKLPIVCNRYAIYRTDIEPYGFKPLLFDGYVTDETMSEIQRVLNEKDYRDEIVERNFAIAKKYFSYQTVENELMSIFKSPSFAAHMDC